MLPSSRMTSQMTAAGFQPASRARSTLPSVWPARSRTAFLGPQREDVARGDKIVRAGASDTAARMVVARSKAEMPVETPTLGL